MLDVMIVGNYVSYGTFIDSTLAYTGHIPEIMHLIKRNFTL